MDHASDPPALPSKAWPFVEQLVPLAGQLHLLFAHMEHYEAEGLSAPDAPPVQDVLASLLDSILAPLARRRPEDLDVAAQVLADVARAVEHDLFVVAPPGRAERRARGRAAARRRRPD